MVKNKLFLICVLSFILITIVSLFVFEQFPFSGDEYSYVFQAKIFKNAKLYYDSPMHTEFFMLHHVVNNGKWYSKYLFGWPLILTLGESVNLGWIVNPLISVITLIVLFYFVRFIFNEKVAYISVLLMLVSPFFIFNSASYFPHSSSLLFAILFLFSYFLTLKKEGGRYPIFAGVCFLILFFIRPIDCVIIGLPIAIYSILELIKNKKLFKKFLIIFVVACIFLFIPLYFNYVLTGNALKFSYQVYNPYDKLSLSNFKIGFSYILYHFNFLFFWFPLTLLFILFARYGKINKLFLFIFIFNVFLYLFYVGGYGGDQFGPRYYYVSFAGLVILAGSGADRLKKKWIIGLLVLVNLCFGVYFASDIHKEVVFRKQVYDFTEKSGIHNSLIFLKSTKKQGCEWYTRNSPELNDDNLFVCDLGEKNQLLMDDFPDRKTFFYDLANMGEPYSDYSKRLVW